MVRRACEVEAGGVSFLPVPAALRLPEADETATGPRGADETVAAELQTV